MIEIIVKTIDTKNNPWRDATNDYQRKQSMLGIRNEEKSINFKFKILMIEIESRQRTIFLTKIKETVLVKYFKAILMTKWPYKVSWDKEKLAL